MKIQIVASTIGGNPLRHLDAGQVMDMAVEEVAPLYQSGKARLVDDAADRADLIKFLKKQDARVLRQTDGGRR